MYAFPKIELPAAAVEAAEEAGQVSCVGGVVPVWVCCMGGVVPVRVGRSRSAKG